MDKHCRFVGPLVPNFCSPFPRKHRLPRHFESKHRWHQLPLHHLCQGQVGQVSSGHYPLTHWLAFRENLQENRVFACGKPCFLRLLKCASNSLCVAGDFVGVIHIQAFQDALGELYPVTFSSSPATAATILFLLTQ